jgi:hypothetical protein
MSRVNNQYRLPDSERKVALVIDELRSCGYECAPAWITIEIDNDRYTAYFGRLTDSLRKERNRHERLGKGKTSAARRKPAARPYDL